MLKKLSESLHDMIDYYSGEGDLKKFKIANVMCGTIELDNVIRFLDDAKKGCENGDQNYFAGDGRTCRLADYGLCACDRVFAEGARGRRRTGDDGNSGSREPER